MVHGLNRRAPLGRVALECGSATVPGDRLCRSRRTLTGVTGFLGSDPGRALAEADVSGWKRVIGPSLRSQTNRRQATGVTIAAAALNPMLDLGRPGYVRIA